MKQEQLKKIQIEEIRHLLSHLHGEVTGLDASYHRLLLVLEKFEGTTQFDEVTGVLSYETFGRKWKDHLSKAKALGQNTGLLTLGIDESLELQEVHGAGTFREVKKRVAQLLKRYESPNCLVGSGIPTETSFDFVVAFSGTDAEIVAAAEMMRRFVERIHGPVIDLHGKPSAQVQWKCTLSVGSKL
ncbi:unnamed protein product [Sphagnum jensenii]|uniref:GGDEF domain-containing protein n=1 Tax=Sphagnum jensenii TaxID=128206 RepID=A0ABP0V5G9_9BRYO